MTCIKTGCVVYLLPHGEWIYGDAHSYGSDREDAENTGVLVILTVFRTHDQAELAQFGNVRHFTVVGRFQWWDEEKTSMSQNSTVIVEPGYWTNYGYDGIPEPRITVSTGTHPPQYTPDTAWTETGSAS